MMRGAERSGRPLMMMIGFASCGGCGGSGAGGTMCAQLAMTKARTETSARIIVEK
jgi:hypothetical protein